MLTGDGDLALRTRDAAGRAHEDETALYGPMDEVPTECAFAPDGAKVAIAYPEGVAVHLLRDDPHFTRYVTLPFPRASHLAWSTDGRELVVAGQPALVELTQSKQRLVAQWRLDGATLHAVFAASPAAIARGALWAHDGCGWQRAAAGGPLRLVGPPNPEGSCARDLTVDVVRSPDGRFVAAASGRYGSRTLLVAPVP